MLEFFLTESPHFLLFSPPESETRQQSAAVLHATSCGWRLPGQEAQNRQCECPSVLVFPSVSAFTDTHSAHISPQLPESSRENTHVTPPYPACHKSWQINSSATFLDHWTMRHWRCCGWKPTQTQRHIVRHLALLSCTLEEHDVFDRHNYVACHSLFAKKFGCIWVLSHWCSLYS